MDPLTLQDPDALVRAFAAGRHWVVTHEQLRALGLGPDSIKHRVKTGRLHPVHRGVYAVGRPALERKGLWLAAVLGCGDEAMLSHRSAAALWGMVRGSDAEEVEIVTPGSVLRGRRGIRVHRRADLGPRHRREVDGIPVTDPVSTLVDLASCAREWQVEQAINAADRLDLVDAERLRRIVPTLPPRPGMACMRRLAGCDSRTDTGLERRFLGIVRRAGLPDPETQAMVSGYRVDFYWREFGLVVEADGWRYHRTPVSQATDRRRDQAHARAGLTTLRFGEHQIRQEPDTVQRTLTTVVDRIRDAAPPRHPEGLRAAGCP